LRLKVVQRVRPVQRTQVEILRAELVLRQQRTEYEDGVIAAREGFRVGQLGKPAGAGLVYAGRSRAHSRAGSGYGLISRESQPDRLAQRERVLRPNSSGEGEQQGHFHDFGVS
jgi:hypothetical protein